ncbi:hypothetical protein AB0G06_44145 [Nonomuraea dietziae]|uniref:hypothetical protein n=1 Tax=Nonomuraea dietziae TaxID=65515 RepID=UPI00340DE925
MLGRDWVGFGMSSMSQLDGNVFFNDRNIRSYIDKVKAGASPAVQSSRMSAAARMRFAFLYGFRQESYRTSLFSDRFGVTLEEVFANKLRNLEQRGLLTHDEDTIALTLPGVLALSTIEDYINDMSDAAALKPIEFTGFAPP